jgi:F-type H+-transporting ATPase subunit gamma
MAQLIYMRQRIKAVETIKKITHAMRLISMSTHSRLKHKKLQLETYKDAFQKLASLVRHALKQELETYNSQIATHGGDLLILVGSQKGLIGTFNTYLFKFFELEVSQEIINQADIITIGKHATDYIKQKNKNPIAEFNDFTSLKFVTIAQEVTDIILNSQNSSKRVTVFSNYPKSFFVQKPQKTQLIPFNYESAEGDAAPLTESNFIWEQSPEELYSKIQELMIMNTLQELLFESLLTEQSARFLSMDASTRNAEELLNNMKLEYNKIRQAAITRELTELASSY